MDMKTLIWILLLSVPSHLYSQFTILTLGADGSGNGGSLSISVGELAYENGSGTSYSLTQGVQQTYGTQFVTNPLEVGVMPKIRAFPNPMDKLITIEVPSLFSYRKLGYILYDINGKSLKTGILSDKQTSIETLKYPPSTYIPYHSRWAKNSRENNPN